MMTIPTTEIDETPGRDYRSHAREPLWQVLDAVVAGLHMLELRLCRGGPRQCLTRSAP